MRLSNLAGVTMAPARVTIAMRLRLPSGHRLAVELAGPDSGRKSLPLFWGERGQMNAREPGVPDLDVTARKRPHLDAISIGVRP